jgi:hypothetical protein
MGDGFMLLFDVHVDINSIVAFRDQLCFLQSSPRSPAHTVSDTIMTLILVLKPSRYHFKRLRGELDWVHRPGKDFGDWF